MSFYSFDPDMTSFETRISVLQTTMDIVSLLPDRSGV